MTQPSRFTCSPVSGQWHMLGTGGHQPCHRAQPHGSLLLGLVGTVVSPHGRVSPGPYWSRPGALSGVPALRQSASPLSPQQAEGVGLLSGPPLGPLCFAHSRHRGKHRVAHTEGAPFACARVSSTVCVHADSFQTTQSKVKTRMQTSCSVRSFAGPPVSPPCTNSHPRAPAPSRNRRTASTQSTDKKGTPLNAAPPRHSLLLVDVVVRLRWRVNLTTKKNCFEEG